MSEYDVISNFGSLISHENEVFRNFCISHQLRSNLVQGLKIGCWFLFWAQKVVLGTISDNITQKPLFYVILLAKRLLEIVLPWATPKIPGDQKLFEKMCYMLKLKVTKFQLPRLNGFWAILKTTAGVK